MTETEETLIQQIAGDECPNCGSEDFGIAHNGEEFTFAKCRECGEEWEINDE